MFYRGRMHPALRLITLNTALSVAQGRVGPALQGWPVRRETSGGAFRCLEIRTPNAPGGGADKDWVEIDLAAPLFPYGP